MRAKCAAFILTNPRYITGIRSIIHNTNIHRNLIQRKQLTNESPSCFPIETFRQFTENLAKENAEQLMMIVDWLASNSLYLDIQVETLTLLYPHIKIFERAGFKLDYIRLYRGALDNHDCSTFEDLRRMLVLGMMSLSIYCSYEGINHVERLQEYKKAIENNTSYVELEEYGIVNVEHICADPHIVIIHMCENIYCHYIPGKKDIIITDPHDGLDIPFILRQYYAHNKHYTSIERDHA